MGGQPEREEETAGEGGGGERERERAAIGREKEGEGGRREREVASLLNSSTKNNQPNKRTHTRQKLCGSCSSLRSIFKFNFCHSAPKRSERHLSHKNSMLRVDVTLAGNTDIVYLALLRCPIKSIG